MIKIIERDGRYFLQDEFGEEKERTLEQLRQGEQQLRALQEHLQESAEMYRHMHVKVGAMPKDADTYIRLKLHFRNFQKLIEESFREEKELDSFFKLFELSIANLKLDLANPHSNKELISFQIRGYKGLKTFVKLFPKKQPAPPATVTAAPQSDPLKSGTAAADATGPFAPLLLNYTVSELTQLLITMGIVDAAGKANSAASPGAWVGIIYGLSEVKPARLRGSKAAVRRAFMEAFGAVVSESSVHSGLGTRGSEAEKLRDQTLTYLETEESKKAQVNEAKAAEQKAAGNSVE